MQEPLQRVRSTLGWTGGLLLMIGLFLPVWKVSFGAEHRSENLFLEGKGDGVLLVLPVLVSFWMLGRGAYRGLWLTATGCLALLIWIYARLHAKKEEILNRAAELSGGASVREVPEYVMNLGSPEWGWLVLLSGVALMCACAAWPSHRPSSN